MKIMNETFELVKKTFEENSPMYKFLGLEILELSEDSAKVDVRFRRELVGDFRNNRWHGGIIATIMDSVGGIVGATHFTSLDDKIATNDLRVDFLKGAEDTSFGSYQEVNRSI